MIRQIQGKHRLEAFFGAVQGVQAIVQLPRHIDTTTSPVTDPKTQNERIKKTTVHKNTRGGLVAVSTTHVYSSSLTFSEVIHREGH